MKKAIVHLLLGFACIIQFTACVTNGGNANIYSEPSISPSQVKIRSVAIVPNRLPIQLQNSEMWRQYNWQLIANTFTSRGFRVIEYNTSVQSFTNSGLPLEDTKSSRDKYAELAENLNVELIIIPYYGTSYNMEPGFFTNENNYISVGSLQIYYAPQNDFLARLDFDGKKSVSTNAAGMYMLFSLLPSFLSDPTDPNSASDAATLSGIGVGLLALSDLMNSVTSSTDHWKDAYKDGINKAMYAFFSKYNVMPSGGYSTEQNNQPSSANIYEKFSNQELELLKKNAVDSKDYKKAAEIKAELDRRKK